MKGFFARETFKKISSDFSSLPFNYKVTPKSWREIEYKEYPRYEQLPLPEPRELNVSLGTILKNRRSRNKYAHTALTLEDLSTILFKSANLQNPDKNGRPYPSGGARYPLEIYVLASNVENLPIHTYHYNLKKHCLEKLVFINDFSLVKEHATHRANWAKGASAVILISTIWNRTMRKYDDFGYSLIMLEAGHLLQNLQLTAEARNLAYRPFAAFKFAELHESLDIGDKRDEHIVCALALGNKVME
jgi:SagB-type dehydrogenase family enzyme